MAIGTCWVDVDDLRDELGVGMAVDVDVQVDAVDG